MRGRIGAIVSVAVAMACGGDGGDGNPFDSADTGLPADGGDGLDDGGDDGAATGGTDGGVDGSAGDDDGADDGGDGPKLDVGANDTDGPPCAGDNCAGDGCTYVDLLFVIDNSGSMGDYQAALGLAFPMFAQTLVDTLPPGTNVHVGVTSTEMAYSSMGSTSISNGQCTFTGDGGQPHTAFYVTPDVMDTGKNGAQGRLYDPGGGQYYFEFDTDAPPDVLADLEAWFDAAANIGEGGSNIEMSAAPAGWFVDPANDATNAGFVRDEGAVLVIFFVQDEPDQTPVTFDGQMVGPAMLDKVAAAKAGCGGLACVIAGGFLADQACSADGNLPLDDFIDGVGQSPVVAPLPGGIFGPDDPVATANEMNETLSDTLAVVIAQTCEQIPPAG